MGPAPKRIDIAALYQLDHGPRCAGPIHQRQATSEVSYGPMSPFLLLKTLHILSAMLFLGAKLMTAWYKLRVDLTDDVRVIVWYQREMVRADWLFTTPSAVLLPGTGVAMALIMHYPLLDPWLLWIYAGFVIEGVLWLPAVWIQIRMRALAEQALEANVPLDPEFRRLGRIWRVLGYPAFAIAVVMVLMMVTHWYPGR